MANILIVDDDPTIVHLLTNLIDSFGETPITAMQGSNFFQIIEEESIDLILLDIYMPIVNGLTLIRQLKSNNAYQHIPVIMITGMDNLNMMTECFEAGAADFITKPFSPVVLQARLTSILERQKDIIRLQQEIAERKKAEISLRKLSVAMEQSPNILFLTDERYRIEYANPQCIQITGYQLDEILGRSPQIFQADSEKTNTYDKIFKTMSKTEIWKGEICNQKKDGTLFWVSCSISPVLNEDRQVTHFLSIQEDISDRIKADNILAQKTESLKISENRLRMIIEATSDGIVVVGQDKVIHFVNPATENLLGKTAKNLVGQIFKYPLIPNKMTEIKIERTNQSDIVADLRVVKTETDDGLVWVASIRDISNKWETTQNPSTQSTQSELPQNTPIVKAPSSTELQNEPIHNEHVQNIHTGIVSNMSHEFRTPMHAILSFANFGIKKIQDVSREKLLHYFEQIKLSANRLMPLINDLLELYNLESGKRLLTTRPQDILPIILLVIQEQQIVANEKQIKISLIPPECKTTVTINKNSMIKVVRNIVRNAIQFSGQKTEIEITIGCKRNYLEICISDEGVGIPEKDIQHIFSKFYQCEQSRPYDGSTGIGLAICKHIIIEHNGKIWAQNNIDKGASIYFTLPVASV